MQDFARFRASCNGHENGLANFRRVTHGAKHDFRLRVVSNDIRSTAAGDGAYVESTLAKERIFRKRDRANRAQDIKQRVNGGVAELRVCGVRKLSMRCNFEAKSALRAERKLIFRGLAVDEEARAARINGGDFCAGAVALFTDHEEQSDICRAGVEQFFRGGGHRGDDAFGVARAAAPDAFGVFERGEKRWDGVHVRRKRDDGLAPARKYIVAVRLDRHALEAARSARRENGQLREQKVGHVLLVVGRRLDIDERARKFEKIHSDRLFLEGTKRKEGTATELLEAAASR